MMYTHKLVNNNGKKRFLSISYKLEIGSTLVGLDDDMTIWTVVE